jgi:predicted flap endonuclease-1-like 5' DNA nuclease
MRLDYALYGLAIVLFALTAITFFYVQDVDGRLLYVAATAIVGILSVGGGVFLRPKVTASAPSQTAIPEQSTQQTVVAEPAQAAGGPIVEAPTTQLVEAPKAETPIAVEAPPKVQIAQPVEEPKVEPIPVPAMGEEKPVVPDEAAVEAATPAPAAPKMEFAQIRGISEKRAEQLRAVGVNSLQDLANAAPDDLAAKLNVSPKIVKMWIGSAKKLAK